MLTTSKLHVPCRNNTFVVYAATTFSMLLYAIWAFMAKAAMEAGASPIVFTFYRIAGGTVLLFCSVFFIRGDGPNGHGATKGLADAFGREDFPKFCFLGLLMVLNIFGFIFAASRLPAMTCSIFQPVMPVIAMLLSVMWGVEELTRHRVGGVLCSMLGAMVIVLLGAPHQNLDKNAGSMASGLQGFPFIIMNVSGSAAYFVSLKGVLRFYHPTVATAMSYLPAAVFSGLAALTVAGFDEDMWALGHSKTCYIAIVYAIFCTTALNYSILAWATKETSPTTTTVFTTLQPLFGACIAYLVFGHSLSAGQTIGGCFIVIGLLLNVKAQIDNESDESKALLPEKARLLAGALS